MFKAGAAVRVTRILSVLFLPKRTWASLANDFYEEPVKSLELGMRTGWKGESDYSFRSGKTGTSARVRTGWMGKMRYTLDYCNVIDCVAIEYDFTTGYALF